MKKKLIPYGRELKEMQCAGIKPTNDVYLFMGKDAWEKTGNFKNSRLTTLCMPPFTNPFDFEWPVKNCDILIFDTSASNDLIIENIVICLFKNGANIVRYCSQDHKLTIFEKDFNNA